MKFHVITSFNQKYYDILGKDSVESFLNLWPKEIPITCYVEEFEITDFHDNRLIQVGFEQLSPAFKTFSETQKSKTVKFAKKAFSIIHAMEHIDTDVLIWVDADTITIDKIPLDFLKSLIGDKLSCHLGVRYTELEGNSKFKPGDFYCCETGFFMLNKNHRDFEKFKNRYTEIYNMVNVPHLRRFFDGDVYGSVINELIDPKDYNDINLENIRTCFDKSVLGQYINHYKGKNAKRTVVPTYGLKL